MNFTDTLHLLIERYGLIAIFAGCVAEGESAAVLAGFFVHQHVFPVFGAVLATFGGAFLGDLLFFLIGRRFSGHAFVQSICHKPGFSHALDLVARRPSAYVILNRYVYGFRVIGGVAAGLSSLPLPKFIVLNAISAFIWATLFLSIGFVFGKGVEHLFGEELRHHQRLLIAIAVVAVVAITASYVVHRMAKMRKTIPLSQPLTRGRRDQESVE